MAVPCKAVADRLGKAEDCLFTLWVALERTQRQCDRHHDEFGRRIKTQTVLPSAECAAMLYSALLAGQITVRKVDGQHVTRSRQINQLTRLPDPIFLSDRRPC